MVSIEFVGDKRAKLGESPLWDDREGKILWVDSLARTVFRADPDGSACEEWIAPSAVGSIALAETGLLVALQDGFYALDLDNGRFDPIALPERGNENVRFNDGKADRQGRFLSGTLRCAGSLDAPGKLFRLERDGSTTILEAGIVTSNCLCFSPKGDRMYFADSANRFIWCYEYEAMSGAVSNRRVLIDTSFSGSAPDGATVDAAGNLWVALFQADLLIQVSPDGKLLQSLPVPVRFPSCPAFGGQDLTTLYVTTISDAGPSFTSDHSDAGRMIAINGLGVGGIPESRCLQNGGRKS